MRAIVWTAAAAASVLLLAGTALAATPAQTCQSGKNKEAGRYTACRQKVEAKYALQGNPTARAIGLEKCLQKYAANWTQLESRSGGACPSTGDQSPMQQALDAASTDVAAALAGGPLAGQARPLKTGQTRCWNVAGQIIGCPGTGQDGDLQNGAERAYVDNGEGTITDTTTGLMWEKLSNDTSIHDKDNTYTWDNAFAYKIAILNLEGYAGYRDWRVPNVTELQSIVDYGTYWPSVSPAFNTNCVEWCTVLTCSCTQAATYWASSSYHPHPTNTWSVGFYDGNLSRDLAPVQSFHVRAVRGGS